MKGKEREEKGSKKRSNQKAAVGVGVGTLVGLTAGVLLAPKSGKETREEIADNAKKAAGSITNNTKKAAGKITEASKKAMETIRESVGDIKEKIAETRSNRGEADREDDGIGVGSEESNEIQDNGDNE